MGFFMEIEIPDYPENSIRTRKPEKPVSTCFKPVKTGMESGLELRISDVKTLPANFDDFGTQQGISFDSPLN
jgi:hypothetical protein